MPADPAVQTSPCDNPEERLARCVIAWLRRDGWDVYEEVRGRKFSSNVADIVAVREGIVWAIECKMSFNLTVIAQANAWKSSMRSVAVPCRRRALRHPVYRMARQVCERFEIGVIEVGRWGDVYETHKAPIVALHAQASRFMLARLHAGQKNAARAGSRGGGCWTPYGETMKRARAVIEEQGGLTLREVLRSMGWHHYGTWRRALRGLGHALREYESWCHVDDSQSPARYYAADAVPPEVARRGSLFARHAPPDSVESINAPASG